MNFTCKIDIDLPIDKVIDLFDNVDNLKEWQDGFLREEPISGIPKAPDSKSRIFFKQGKGEMQLVETIIVNDLPNERIAQYVHEHMTNLKTDRFISLCESQTRWESEIDYIKFNGFMPKLMAMLFPGMFKKPPQKWMEQFKVFAEKRFESKE